MSADAVVHADGPVPDGVLDAFWRYDVALLTNDVAELDALFAVGPDTLRADGNGVLVGHDAIADFRSARSERPNRRVRELWLRVLSPSEVYTTASVVAPSGGTGLQTQLWRLADAGWQVAAAHVTAAPPAADPAVWRVVGTPLVAGSGRGPLAGEKVVVKDLFAVEGVRRSGGVKALLAESTPEPAHAAAVAALLDAGADVVGVAHTDQLAFGLGGRNADFGTPTNLAAPDRLPGGSTSGPAVAVSRGWATIALGTDTAGSIRVPASYQGLWGFRPTHGSVDATGVLALAPSFDTVGWIARDGATVLRVADALLADAPDLAGPVVRSADADAVADPSVLALLDVVDTVDAAPLPDLADWFAAFRQVQAHEAWEQHGPWLTEHPGAVADDVMSRFTAGADDSDVDGLRAVLARARARLIEVIGDGCLLLPTVGSTVPRLNASAEENEAHRLATLRLTTLASMAGLPAVSIPAGRVGGAPAGVSFVGAPGDDRALLRRAVGLAETWA